MSESIEIASTLTNRVTWSVVILAVFVVYHRLYRDDRGARFQRVSDEMSLASFRTVYILIKYGTAAACIAGIWSQNAWTLGVALPDSVRHTGVGLAALGCTLACWAKRVLGTSYSPCYASSVPRELVAAGPYRWVRHPLYSANLIALFSVFMISGSAWILVSLAVVTAYYIAAAVHEERVLAGHWAAYRAYMNRTGRFVPRVRRRRD